MREELIMLSTTAIAESGGEQHYSVSLAPHTGFSPGAGTWNPCSDFPIRMDWLPVGTPAVHIDPPSATAPERVRELTLPPPPIDLEQRGWLKLAESAFAFWDTPDDDGWDRL